MKKSIRRSRRGPRGTRRQPRIIRRQPRRSRIKKMSTQVHGESLSDDRLVKTQCDQDAKWISGSSTVLPHFLNEEKIAGTIKKNAILVPFEKTIESKTGESITIQCSTGAYYVVGVNLCHSWMAMLGQSSSEMDGQRLEVAVTRGMRIKVEPSKSTL